MRGELFERLAGTAAGLVLLLGLGLLIAAGLATMHTIRRLSRPPRRSYAWAVAKGLPGDPSELDVAVVSPAGSISQPTPEIQRTYTEWTYRSRGLDLPVWDIVGGSPDAPTLVFTHGWGESRITSLERVQTLRALFSRIILWDMPGHGDAPGRCTLGAHEPEDLVALLAAISPRDGGTSISSPDERPTSTGIVLMGFSLGAGVSIAAAGMLDVNADGGSIGQHVHEQRGRTAAGSVIGVIAEAPYRVPITPAKAVLAAAAMPWRVNLPLAMAWLGLRNGHGLAWARSSTAERFDRAAHARHLQVPLLVVHGVHDTISPPTDGRSIADASPSGIYAPIDNASHLDIWKQHESRAKAVDAITSFVETLTVNPPQS